MPPRCRRCGRGNRSMARRRSRSHRAPDCTGWCRSDAPCARPHRHTRHGDRRDRRGSGGANTMQRRRTADRHSHRRGMTGTGGATQNQADRPVHHAQPVGLPAETRKVAEAAPVGTMNPPGRCPTRGARNRYRRPLCSQRDAGEAVVGLVNDMKTRKKTNQMQGKLQGDDRIEGAVPFIW